MGRKRTPGLIKRNGIWHIDKQIGRKRVCESTGTSSVKEASQILAKRIEEVRQQIVFGIRPPRTFRQAAMHYVETADIDSIDDAAHHIKWLDPCIGKLTLDCINMMTLKPFIDSRKRKGLKNRTINF